MYCGGMGTPRRQKLGGSTAFLARPRLGALKNIYANTRGYSKPAGSCVFDKKKKTKKPSVPKMEFRKKPDYADTAYREAVSRLRILLAESYTPVKRSVRAELDSAGEETDNQSLISGVSRVSRYPHYHSTAPIKKYPYYSTKSASHYTADDKGEHLKCEAPPELMTFIERQEDYIEQLERESRFCREELSTLLGKVKDVITENETLHEKQKNSVMKSVFDQFKTETETETDLDLTKTKSPRGSRKPKVLEGPAIVFESRISELEAQLTQTKIDLKKAQEENEALRKKCADGGTSESFEANRKQVESLQRDKAILQETVSKLQAALNLLRDKEHNTTDQVKRSLDVAEQAQYEKSAAEHEIRRLKDELERQHAKLREAISEQSRRVADERAAVERRYSQQIEQLTAELGVHWEQSSKFQLEVDKQRRENADARRELAQKQALIDELKKDMQNKIITLQSDIGVSGAEKSALEQQITNLQMANERCERQAKQEASRLQAEMQSLRQRLDRADADLIHSRRENIRLTEQIAALEKEINMNAALADERKRHTGDVIALPPPKEVKEEMSAMIQDMEAKHVATVAELEGMIQSQNQLMDKLSSECHALTQKLEESSARHKEEIRGLQTNLDCLTSRFSQSQIKPTNERDENVKPSQPSIAPVLNRTSSKPSIQPQTNEAPKQSEQPKQFHTKPRENIAEDNESKSRVNEDVKQQQPAETSHDNQLYGNASERNTLNPESGDDRYNGSNQDSLKTNGASVADNQYESNVDNNQYKSNVDNNQYESNADKNQHETNIDNNQLASNIDNNQPESNIDKNQYESNVGNNQQESNIDNNQYESNIGNNQQESNIDNNQYDSNINNQYESNIDNNQSYQNPDGNQQQGYYPEGSDPNQVDSTAYEQQQGYSYDQQQYDPNQEYMTQEQYDQQYANYDPNAQYVEGNEGNYNTEQYKQ